MRHNAHKLLALVMALAMLLSFFAVAEDGMTDLGMDEPIEILDEVVDKGETGNDGDTQAPEGELEIELDEGEGLPDGAIDPEGGEDLDLGLDLNSAALEIGEEELAPVTEAAMNAAGDGKSAATAIEVNGWNELVANINSNPPAGEDKDNPTYYKLTGDAEDSSSAGVFRVPGGRYVVLDLNGHKVDGNECNRSVIAVGGSLTITDSQGNGTITGSKNTGFGGGVFVEEGGQEQDPHRQIEGCEVWQEDRGSHAQGALVQQQRERRHRGQERQGQGYRQGELHRVRDCEQRRAHQCESRGQVP